MAKDLAAYFRSEAKELIGRISEDLLSFEKAPDQETLIRILRHAHTLKGAARVVGQKAMADSVHGFEEALEPYRAKPGALPTSEMTGLLRSIDQLSVLLLEMEQGESGRATSKRPVSSGSLSQREVSTPPAWSAPSTELETLLEDVHSTFLEFESMRRSFEGLERQRALLDLLVSQLQSHPKLRGSKAIAEELSYQTREFERSINGSAEQLERELQQVRVGAEKLRLTRADSLFPLLRRAVRDSALQAERQVEFVALGGDVRLENHLLAAISGALVQAISNAIAHGIEPSVERVKKGKTAHGNVCLEVRRDGREVIFCCRDDGRGVDLVSARRELENRGVSTKDWTDSAVLEVLMDSGVSTAQGVTLTSGRGLGLGLVHEAASILGGRAVLKTEAGVFTELNLHLPWSRVVLEFLQVQTGLDNENGLHQVLIPLEQIKAATRLNESQVSRSDTSETLLFEGEPIRLISLSEVLGHTPSLEQTAVLLKARSKLVALAVDSLKGIKTASLMPLPPWSRASDVITGAVLDVEGNPQLVLDPDGLLNSPLVPRVKSDRRQDTVSHRLLVIDDSLTTRTLQESILKSSGFTVDLACSGEEGLEALEKTQYSLILVDVEMPGIDGFTFIETLQAGPHRETPAVLVTSRDSAEDKAKAQKVGAKGYIVKSEYTPKALLRKVHQILNGQRAAL